MYIKLILKVIIVCHTMLFPIIKITTTISYSSPNVLILYYRNTTKKSRVLNFYTNIKRKIRVSNNYNTYVSNMIFFIHKNCNI